MSYMSDKSLDIYEQGIDGWYDGIRNPYQENTHEYIQWEKGWHSENRRQECFQDYISGEE